MRGVAEGAGDYFSSQLGSRVVEHILISNMIETFTWEISFPCSYLLAFGYLQIYADALLTETVSTGSEKRVGKVLAT